jgi:hypothetical protein
MVKPAEVCAAKPCQESSFVILAPTVLMIRQPPADVPMPIVRAQITITHTITSGIVGAAASRRVSDVRWSVLQRIVLAWIVTFPVCALIAFAAAVLANMLFTI